MVACIRHPDPVSIFTRLTLTSSWPVILWVRKEVSWWPFLFPPKRVVFSPLKSFSAFIRTSCGSWQHWCSWLTWSGSCSVVTFGVEQQRWHERQHEPLPLFLSKLQRLMTGTSASQQIILLQLKCMTNTNKSLCNLVKLKAMSWTVVADFIRLCTSLFVRDLKSNRFYLVTKLDAFETFDQWHSFPLCIITPQEANPSFRWVHTQTRSGIVYPTPWQAEAMLQSKEHNVSLWHSEEESEVTCRNCGFFTFIILYMLTCKSLAPVSSARRIKQLPKRVCLRMNMGNHACIGGCVEDWRKWRGTEAFEVAIRERWVLLVKWESISLRVHPSPVCQLQLCQQHFTYALHTPREKPNLVSDPPLQHQLQKTPRESSKSLQKVAWWNQGSNQKKWRCQGSRVHLVVLFKSWTAEETWERTTTAANSQTKLDVFACLKTFQKE